MSRARPSAFRSVPPGGLVLVGAPAAIAVGLGLAQRLTAPDSTPGK
ncbi:hypothetical protein [Nocardia sp. JMUB6875]